LGEVLAIVPEQPRGDNFARREKTLRAATYLKAEASDDFRRNPSFAVARLLLTAMDADLSEQGASNAF
jgi:hypothetical protein